jgi:hypothetical protein
MTRRSPTPRFGALSAALLVSASLLLPAGEAVRAQETDRTEAFVYGINAAVYETVVGTFAPPSVESIYLLAGQTSVLSPRETLVYYWPITNDYRAAWSQLNELVDGELEILSAGRSVDTLPLTSYTVHFTVGETGRRPSLYLGAEAEAAHRQFMADRDAHQQATLDYQRELEEWRGRDDRETVPVPTPPESLEVFTTGLNRGFPIDLEPGRYEIRHRLSDGSIQPHSERELVVIEPRRTGIGYTVRPETRWTTPEELGDPSDAVLGSRDSVLYLEPYLVREFETLDYERLVDPQYAGGEQGSRWRWVIGETLDEGALEVVNAGQVVERIPLIPYRVRQIPGSELGYEIMPHDETAEPFRRPEFSAYRIELDSEFPAYQVRLVSSDGRVIPGSEREVRVIASTDLRPLLLVAGVPIAAGALVLALRRRRSTPVHLVA